MEGLCILTVSLLVGYFWLEKKDTDYFGNLFRITNYLERLTGRKSVRNRLYPMSPNIRMMQSI